jgi:arabinan endo-1,5-alpha-L-arabinosidase
MSKPKLLVFSTAVLFSSLAVGAKTFVPTPTPNPWEDDYSDVSSMENYKSWGTYNVHDPACKKIGDFYYMFSTDAIFRENKREAQKHGINIGYLQMRRSRDLVNWEFLGWVFPEIPTEAVEWVRAKADGHGATNMWAPYIVECNGIYRLYYCVSAFGRKTSYIGVAEANSPEGPWTHKGAVVKTDDTTPMNAIDPTIAVDRDGKWWMTYGSYFEGLYCVELDPATGFTKADGDLGHLVARRDNWRVDNLEAPEVIYNQELDKYFLFVSYDPLMTTYNVRVGRSDSAAGPFTDFHGKEMSDTTNNYPILTAPYRFDEHPGWVGTAHCGVFTDGNGKYFMAHQGRLAPGNGMMDLHVREVFFNKEGWPVVSPERYAATPSRTFSANDLVGEWEIIRVQEARVHRGLEAGQILWGEGALLKGEWNLAEHFTFKKAGKLNGDKDLWSFNKQDQSLSLTINDEIINDLIIFVGHDWERKQDTVLFTGLDANGRSVWGKRIK